MSLIFLIEMKTVKETLHLLDIDEYEMKIIHHSLHIPLRMDESPFYQKITISSTFI